MFPRPSSIRMASTAKVVLLACGSFNPVTNMHLRMFELARDSLQRTGRYTVVDGIMSPVSDGYGKKDLLSAKHRIAMLKLALKSLEWVRCDTWESEQDDWSETAKVLKHHQEMLDNVNNANTKPTPTKRRKKIRNNEDDIDNTTPRIIVNDGDLQLKLLCGADLLESFGTPGLWKEEDIEYIVGRHGLVCITRSGADPRKFIYESDILTKYQENIHIVTEWITNDISATKIRRALRRGESVRYLLQESVIQYIREHELYGTPDNKYINHIIPSPNAEIIPSPDDDDSDETESIMSTNVSSDASNMALRSSQRASSDRSTPPRSPKHLINESMSPSRSPQHVPCMTDIGTLVRRVKNYNLRAFQPWKAQD